MSDPQYEFLHTTLKNPSVILNHQDPQQILRKCITENTQVITKAEYQKRRYSIRGFINTMSQEAMNSTKEYGLNFLLRVSALVLQTLLHFTDSTYGTCADVN
jgi:hypothetical protein